MFCLVYNRNKRSKEIVIEKIRLCRFSFSGKPWDEVSDTAKVCPSVLTCKQKEEQLLPTRNVCIMLLEVLTYKK